MLKFKLAFLVCVAALALIGAGCQRPSVAPGAAQAETPPAPPVAAQTGKTPVEANGEKKAVSQTPVRDAVDALMAREASDKGLFPVGTRLVSADVREGVATLNFSAEFSGLADRGETVESEAQKALQRALAPIAGVTKMRALVLNKPFESQATDWATPFSVHTAGQGELTRNARP